MRYKRNDRCWALSLTHFAYKRADTLQIIKLLFKFERNEAHQRSTVCRRRRRGQERPTPPSPRPLEQADRVLRGDSEPMVPLSAYRLGKQVRQQCCANGTQLQPRQPVRVFVDSVEKIF